MMNKRGFLERKAEPERGFTLLEVIVALSILTIGLLAVASMQVAAIKGNAASVDVKEATNLAADKLEKLRALPFDDPLLLDTDADGFSGLNDATADTADQPPEIHGKFSVYVNVATDYVVDNSKTINVIVTWADKGGGRHVTIQQLVPRTG